MIRSLLALILLATPAFAQDEGGGMGWVDLPRFSLGPLLAQAGGTNTMNCRSPSAACRVGSLTTGAIAASSLTLSGLLTTSASGIAGSSSQVIIAANHDLLPAGNASRKLGDTGNRWVGVYTTTLRDAAGVDRLSSIGSATNPNVYQGSPANSGTNTAHVFKALTTLSGSTRIAEFHNDTTAASPEAYIQNDGAFVSLAGATFGGPVNVTGITDLSSTSALNLGSSVSDAVDRVAHQIYTNNALSSSGTQLVTFNNPQATVKSRITSNGEYSLAALDGTAGSGTGITVNATSVNRSFVHKITVAETALTAAATTQDITLWTLPAKTRLLRIVAETTTGFTGGTIVDMAITVGATAGTNGYLLSGSTFAASVLGDAAAELGANLLPATVADIPSMSATSIVTVRYTATGDNVVNATAGSTTFYIIGEVLP
jgi:hypothetical protein